MYFHSASYRHEQYSALKSNPHKKEKKKKRSSLSSNASGVDSGYTSSTSSSPKNGQPSPISQRMADDNTQTPAPTPSQPQLSQPQPSQPQPQPHISQPQQTIHKTRSRGSSMAESHRSGATDSTATTTASGKRPKKKKSKNKDLQREPDLVYSCPRPLAFPFHNDAHFLPVAEADPRDVARVTPQPSRRASSVQSSKASTTSSSYYYNPRASLKSSVHGETDTIHSRRSSILSSMQRGTVRSLRSLFQLPHHDLPPPPAYQHYSPPPSNEPQHKRLPRLDIAKGTVSSLRHIFAKHPEPPPPPTRMPPAVAATSGVPKRAPSRPPSVQLDLPPPPPKKKPSKFASFFAKPKPAGDLLEAMPKPPTTPPSYSTASHKKSPLSSLKKMFARSDPKHTSSSHASASHNSASPPPYSPTPPPPSPPLSASTASPAQVPSPAPAPPRKSFFASFRRSSSKPPRTSVPPPDQKKKPSADATQQQDEAAASSEPSVVRRIWKSFKRIVSGSKTSRVGVL